MSEESVPPEREDVGPGREGAASGDPISDSLRVCFPSETTWSAWLGSRVRPGPDSTPSRTTPHPTCPFPPPAVLSSSLLPSQATRVCAFLPHLPSGTCCPRLWSCPQGHVAGPCPWPPCCPHMWRRSGVLRLNQCLAVCGYSLSPRTMLKVWQKG